MQESNENVRAPELGSRLLKYFVASEFILLSGNLLVRVLQNKSLLPPWAISVVAVATVLPMLIFATAFFRLLRADLDEMLERIVLEGLGFAMIVFVPLAGLYVNARAAGLISLTLDPPEILLIPSLLAVVGVLNSWSRLK